MKLSLYVFTLMLFFCITYQGTTEAKQSQGQAKIDDLIDKISNTDEDTTKVKLLGNLSHKLCSSNPDLGIKYGLKGVNLAKKIGFKRGEADCYNSTGLNFKSQSEYDQALKFYNKAFKINEEINDKIGMSSNLSNIGVVFQSRSDNPMALEYYYKALKINKEIDHKAFMSVNYSNIALVHMYQSDYPKAIEFFHKAIKINENIDNKDGIANNLLNIAIVYANQTNYDKSLEFFLKSMKMNEELGNKKSVAANLGNIGLIYKYKSNNTKALEYYHKALKLNEELGNKVYLAINIMNIGVTYKEQGDYSKALEYFHKAIEINEEIGNKNSIASNLLNIGLLYLTISTDSDLVKLSRESMLIGLNKDINLNKSIDYLLDAKTLYTEIKGLHKLSATYNFLHRAYYLKGMYKLSVEAHRKYKELQDSVFSTEKNNKIAALEKTREDDVNRIKIEKQEVQLAAQESEKMFIIYSGIGIIVFVIAILVLIAYQRKKSDKLLYNVLPITIAKRLKKKEHPISDHFAQASIIFIDIVGFTAMSKDSDPTDIVHALNKVFTHYDSIASKHGLEKIKTIGDCYMAAAGIPVIQKDNTLKAARMALEVRDYMVDYYTDHGFKLDVRIGLDCGPVVAGVIGEKKFIYDMWSDAVNTASRMESTGQSGSVHISERFKEAVEEFDEFEFIDRGEMEVKGKGKMKTFFIEDMKVGVG